MDVEAVREEQRRALLHVRREIVLVDVGLQFIGRDHHHHIGPFGGLGVGHHLEAGGLRLVGADAPGRAAMATSFTPLSRMFSAWAWPCDAEADDGDFLVLDEIQIGIPIVIDAHGSTPVSEVLCRLAVIAFDLDGLCLLAIPKLRHVIAA